MTGEDVASGRLITPFSLAVPIDEAFYLIEPPDEPIHPDAELFRDWLIEEADLVWKPGVHV